MLMMMLLMTTMMLLAPSCFARTGNSGPSTSVVQESSERADDMFPGNRMSSSSSEWHPLYERLLSASSLQDLLELGKATNGAKHHHHSGVKGGRRNKQRQQQQQQQQLRQLQQTLPPCNEVLDSISLTDLKSILSQIVDTLAPPPSLQNTIFQALVVDRLQTGVQIVHVCGSCVDSIPETTKEDHLEYCGPSIYGNNRTHSGFLVIPILDDEHDDGDATTTTTTTTTILPGTHPGFLYLHGTRLSLLNDPPSFVWRDRESADPFVYLILAMASAQRAITLAPHSMGYGESSGDDSYKAYIIRKGYETSIVPLWYQTQTMIREWSGGCSALGNAATVAGYSEGGYSSVVVAHALRQNAGVDIWKVYSGAGPYKVSSEALWGILDLVQTGGDDSSPSILYPIVGLLGVSYSSTYPHLANYNTSQDFLTAANGTRDALVQVVTGEAEAAKVESVINALIGPTSSSSSSSSSSILDLLRPAFVDAIQQFQAQGITDPCTSVPLETLQELEIDRLCAALVENDLTTLLETQVDYPIEFCHSDEDEIVVASNLPDLSANLFLSRVPSVTGSHATAGGTCFLQVLQSTMLSWVADDMVGGAYVIEPLHDEECGASSSSNSSSAPPTLPRMDPSSSSAPQSVVPTAILLLALLPSLVLFLR